MRIQPMLLLWATVVSACGDTGYRCKNPDVSVNDDYIVTKYICNSLGEDTCYCSHWAEDYCDPSGNNIAKFKELCNDQGSNWYWTQC
jgi:hypothetical protein